MVGGKQLAVDRIGFRLAGRDDFRPEPTAMGQASNLDRRHYNGVCSWPGNLRDLVQGI